VQRTAAYAVVADAAGRVLMVRASSRSDLPGRWSLPGGGLRHGEHPREGVLRELAEETGLRSTQATPRDATADVLDLPYRGVSVHTLRLIYDVQLPDPGAPPRLRAEPDGTSDLVRFVDREEAAELAVLPFVADLLGLPTPAPLRPAPPDRPEPLGLADEGEAVETVRVQRPAAYAVLVDEADPQRMLLTRLAGNNDVWTLPGGGIDHGEHPLIALEREVYEETGLPYTVGPLIDIGSRHFIGHGPNARLEDFHALRLIYAGSVPLDRPPRVIEVDGSTDLAAWIAVSELEQFGAVPVVRESLEIWREFRNRRPETAPDRPE
jgi:ADP-ribose pyrophosphatase YjhB (NUDIX family)